MSRTDAELQMMSTMLSRMRRTPTTEERNQLAKARKRADGVYAALGRELPDHLPGETPLAYRQRLADGLKDQSPSLRRANLAGLPAGALTAVEARIYQDAQTAAATGAGIPRGTLRAHRYEAETGHKITEYHGDPMAWMSPFMSGGAKLRVRRPEELR
jgi:hypothetical protein